MSKAKQFIKVLRENIGQPGFKWFDYEQELERLLIESLPSGIDETELKETIKLAAKRSQYSWSEGGNYNAQDYANEGAITLAESLLEIVERNKTKALQNTTESLPNGSDEGGPAWEAADNWVFNVNSDKWSNNDNSAGDNFKSFLAGWRACHDYLGLHNTTEGYTPSGFDESEV